MMMMMMMKHSLVFAGIVLIVCKMWNATQHLTNEFVDLYLVSDTVGWWRHTRFHHLHFCQWQTNPLGFFLSFIHEWCTTTTVLSKANSTTTNIFNNENIGQQNRRHVKMEKSWGTVIFEIVTAQFVPNIHSRDRINDYVPLAATVLCTVHNSTKWWLQRRSLHDDEEYGCRRRKWTSRKIGSLSKWSYC